MREKVKVEELDPTIQERLMSLYKGWKFARYGEGGYIMPETYKQDADDLKTATVRPDDVWVVTFPRSGTTWTQEMVWLLKNNFDYATAAQTTLIDRYVFFEGKHVVRPDLVGLAREDQELPKPMPTMQVLDDAPSPRFIKTHMPLSLLPPNLLETAKVVYVARDPRDVAVSYYHLSRLFFNYSGDFRTYWDLFIQDLVKHSPFFSHLKEAWALRHHKNMLFMFYEDMAKNFRNNKSVNMSAAVSDLKNPNSEVFIRNGESGGWRAQFDAAMAARAQAWLRDNLAGTDLAFPHQE